MPEILDCVVLHGPDLEPRRCRRFAWAADTITAMEIGDHCSQIDSGALVIIPGLVNGHTHVADSALPDGATGLTLEEAFFRPAGYKYRELAKLTEAEHRPHIEAHLRYMARTGTVCHLDFREQGTYGAEVLRQASQATGIRSVILSQLNQPPFTAAELEANVAGLPESARDELTAIFRIADGFSESTMNDLTDPAWREIRDLSTAAGRLRAIHCLENASYRDCSFARTGRGDLDRALDLFDPHLIVHLTVATPAEIARVVQSRKTAVINPRANAVLALPLPPVAALLEAGANLLIGTDNGMLNSPNLLAELDFTWKLARSQSGHATRPEPGTLLRLATRNAHAVLGNDFPGLLELGGPATFVVLDFTAPHLRHTRHILASIVGRVTPADVLATCLHGRLLWSAAGFLN